MWKLIAVLLPALACSSMISACKSRPDGTGARVLNKDSGLSNPDRIDREAVSEDFQLFVETWGSKDQCVIGTPANSENFNDFVNNRGDRWAAFCKSYRQYMAKPGRRSGRKKSLRDFCAEKHDLVCGGEADGSCSKIGNCGEWSLVGTCEAIRRGASSERGLVCQTDNDHVFVMVAQSNGKHCLLDRWHVPEKDNAQPYAEGTILCDVEIVEGCVRAGTTVYEHPWYSDLTCESMDRYFESICN